jgi:uncharacterized RDD family membrane protein YckC
MDIEKVTDEDAKVFDPNPFRAPESEVRDHVEEMPRYELASRFIRLIARILDGFAWFIIYIPLLFLTALESSDSYYILVSLSFILVVCVNIVFIVRDQQTIGKKIVKIRIVRKDYSACSGGRIILRRYLLIWVISSIPFIGPIFGLANILCIFRESRYCLHDDIADTCVVQV